ncbi:MAG: S8 family peptidase [Bacteroidales bacterium]|jgi:subtilisin family serine protease|nr:S8 family peptidase [Bacteroidales bacterium]
MRIKTLIRSNLAWFLTGLLCLASVSRSPAQTENYTYFYRVYFTDKGANSLSHFSAEQLLSPRAIERRQKSGIAVPDYRDLPVFGEYIEQVSALGFRFHCASKWMNTALFKTMNPANTAPVKALPFVAEVKLVRNNIVKGGDEDKFGYMLTEEITPYDRPITMVNGYPLHRSGFDGSGILIAVLDAGFMYADRALSLAALRSRNGIKDTYDFVKKSPVVCAYHTHGLSVLSVLAGQISGVITGTAPAADYILLRSEDASTETPAEEDFWIAAAEYADSSGADIISSSLGYSTFDDVSMNYKFSDLDGNTAFITRAADIAASRGILVVSSAGNERNKPWQRIIAPSDGDSVLAAGAVDGNNFISVFSSAGPSADRQVKPDVSALGVNITVQVNETHLVKANGTSFSCPVLSGMAACLMEAVPQAASHEIIRALQLSADRKNSPDSLYGYGIPDMLNALRYLQDIYIEIPEVGSELGPNPTRGELQFTFRNEPGRMKMDIVNSSGKIIYRRDFGEYAGRNLRINALAGMEQGIYFIRLETDSGTFKYRIVKLND